MASLTDILSAIQNGVVAANNFSKQMTGSFNNINSQLIANSAAWTPYTPIITPAGGTIIAIGTGRFHQIGKTTFVQITSTFSSGAAGTGYINASLPVANFAGRNYIFAGRESNTTGNMLQGVTQGSCVAILNFNGTYPSTNNVAVLNITGVYEAA